MHCVWNFDRKTVIVSKHVFGDDAIHPSKGIGLYIGIWKEVMKKGITRQ